MDSKEILWLARNATSSPLTGLEYDERVKYDMYLEEQVRMEIINIMNNPIPKQLRNFTCLAYKKSENSQIIVPGPTERLSLGTEKIHLEGWENFVLVHCNVMVDFRDINVRTLSRSIQFFRDPIRFVWFDDLHDNDETPIITW